MSTPAHRPVALAERPRRLAREQIYTALLTTRGGGDRHRHCGVFVGETGNGETDAGPDGHVHQIKALDVMPAGGHMHELSVERCPQRHNFDPTHGRLHRGHG